LSYLTIIHLNSSPVSTLPQHLNTGLSHRSIQQKCTCQAGLIMKHAACTLFNRRHALLAIGQWRWRHSPYIIEATIFITFFTLV